MFVSLMLYFYFICIYFLIFYHDISCSIFYNFYSLFFFFFFIYMFFFFFFFQAEDGIRDTSVTGVQTCALPIYARLARLDVPGLAVIRSIEEALPGMSEEEEAVVLGVNELTTEIKSGVAHVRSEERRVGKECRSRWSPDQ